MKKFLITLLMVFVSIISGNAININDDEIKSDVRVDTVKVDIPASIKMYEGDTFDITIKVIDDDYLEKHLKYEKIENCLYIYLYDMYNYNIMDIDSKKIIISIMTPHELSVIPGNRNLTVSSNKNINLEKHENKR